MSRQGSRPSATIRAERLDGLFGFNRVKDLRALTFADLDGVILDLVRSVIENDPVKPAAFAGNPITLKPAAGVFLGNIPNGTITTQIGVANTERISPFITPFDFSIDQVGISVSAAVAASSLKVTIYATDALGRPSAVLAESGNISGSAVGTVMAGISFDFVAGRAYWIGVRYSAASTLRVGQSYATAILSWTSAATPAPQSCLQRTLSFATPATDWAYSAADHRSSRAPFVLMRVV